MSLPPLRHVPQSLLDPFDQVQSITHNLVLAARNRPNSNSHLHPSECLDARIHLHAALTQCRSTMDAAYTTANEAIKTLGEQREAAIAARLAKLNRDWYTSHLDADIDSYERADLTFDPPDLISAQEVRASITIAADLDKFDKMTPSEIMTRRFNAEKMERARANVNVNRQEKARENVIKDLRTQLDREDKRDLETFKWMEISSKMASAYGVDPEALASERAAARAKGWDPNKLGQKAGAEAEAEENDAEVEDGEPEASDPCVVEDDRASVADDAATAGGDSVADVVMSDVPASEVDEDSKSMATGTSGRSTPEASLSGMSTDVEMADVGDEEEEEGALV